MTTLVIPDIHQAIGRANYILSYYEGKYDRVVFLGDYFDTYRRVFSVIETAEWMKRLMLSGKNYTFLLGNHDLQYIFPKTLTHSKVSGYQGDYYTSAVSYILKEQAHLFKFIDFAGDYILTHAGITNPHMINPKVINNTEEWDSVNQELMNCMFSGNTHPLLMPGIDRGGNQLYGGLTWCDLRNFICTPGVNQIFGHTRRDEIVRIQTESSNNYMIDTDMTTAAFVTGSYVKIVRPWETGAQKEK